MPEKKKSSLSQFLLTFALVYLATMVAMRVFFPAEKDAGNGEKAAEIVLTPVQRSVPLGRNIGVTVENRTAEAVVLKDRCPDPPFIILRKEGEDFLPVEPGSPVAPCVVLPEIPGEDSITVDMSPWKYGALAVPGTYRLAIPSGTGGIASTPATEITVTMPGPHVRLFRTFVTKPLLNALILIASVLPGHSLGLAIILLTLIVKLILLVPSQRAMKHQKRVQAVQPRLEEIKRRHAGDTQKITEETMKLWKAEKINPFQSFLPMILQIPILLGLYFIIRDSGTIEFARHLLYMPFLNLDWTFGKVFLGVIDLHAIPFAGFAWKLSSESLRIVILGAPLPFVTAGLQTLQMWLAFRKAKAGKAPQAPDLSFAERLDPQTMMLIVLPLMIFFFSGTLPAAVSLYWIVSTVFAVGQQMAVNRKTEK